MYWAGDCAVLRVVSSLMHLVTAKAARLRTGAVAEGYEQTLLGKELIGSADLLRFMPMYYMVGVSLVGGLAMLVILAGAAPALAGVGVMICVLFFSASVSVRMKRTNVAMLEASQGTTATTREIIDGVKVVKMMGWEQAYLAHVAAKRTAELKHLQKFKTILNIIVNLGRASPVARLAAVAARCGAAWAGGSVPAMRRG